MLKVRVAKGPDRSNNFGVGGLGGHKCLPIIVALVFLILVCPISRAASPAPKNVLVLFSTFERRNTDILNEIEPALRARVPGQITFYDAYLEYSRVKENSYRESQAETFRHTYDGVKFSLVIVFHSEALHFAVQYRDKIFPGVPIVFDEVSTGELESVWPGVTGVTVPVGLRETIDLALRLHPDTEAVAVVSSKAENYWLAVAHSELLRHQDKVREIDLVGPASGQLLERVAALPPHTVVLFQLEPQVSQQSELGAWELLAAIARRLPTYSAWPSLCLNYGCIGGAYPDARKQHLWTAEIAARALSGERSENIPIVHNSDLQVTVDWRALRRWHIPESALPAGTEILYRDRTLWERDRKYIVAAMAVVAAQGLWIFALLWQRTRKRKLDAALTESEGRFQRMANTTPSLVWMSDQEGKVTYLNDRRVEFTGRDPNPGFNDVWTKYIHPDDVEAVLAANARGLERQEKFSKQYRLRRRDGVYRWMFDVAAPRVNGDGSFAGFIGSAADITDQKLAQQALEKVSGQLIEAQEKERSRIARDLHDDICQRLALLSMELEQVYRNDSAEATKRHLAEIQLHCSEIAGDVQSISHQLHSSKLEYLGIVAAVKGCCKELARKHEVKIEFKDANVPTHLPKHVSLCLFRVAQEALHNAIKHSGTWQFTVELTGTANEVRLVVKDAGSGFDVEDVKRGRGLGLVSMQERVHLVHGRFLMESAPGKGTRIIAAVPVVSENVATWADDAADEPTGTTGAA